MESFSDRWSERGGVTTTVCWSEALRADSCSSLSPSPLALVACLVVLLLQLSCDSTRSAALAPTLTVRAPVAVRQSGRIVIRIPKRRDEGGRATVP